MLGDIGPKTPVSSYQPSLEVVELTKNVKRDISAGDEILNRSWVELNDYSVIDRTSKDQRTFNSFVDESVEDPREAWKWRGTRSLARNKTVAMHAHLTAGFIIPNIVAQNDSQQEDRDTSEVMRDMVDWMTINSNYRPSFLLAAQGMLVNPATYLEADYCEVYQTIHERTKEGYTKKEILDEVLSGFNANVMSADQVLITNAYQQNIQRQRAVTKRRYKEYTELKAKYEDHPNWQYLQPGIKAVFNEEDGLFYDVKDEDEHQFLVAEDTWSCRRDDAEVIFLNGIYFGNENVEWNPIKHRDNRNAPKYNLTPFGYQRINEHFFFFKSLINVTGWDNQLLDAMYEVQMNRDFLDLEAPVAITGTDKVDTDIIFPGAVAAFADEKTKIAPILPPNNGRGYQAMQLIEQSMSKSSISDTEMGDIPTNTQAYTVSQAAQNAKILMSGVKQSMGESVRQFGDLMVDIVLQHLTTAQLDEITGNLNYRSFLLADQTVNGKKVSKRIRFDEALMDKEMSEDEKKDYTMKLLTEIGYPDHKEHLYMINPHLFSKMRYLTRVEPDLMDNKSKEFTQALMERVYGLFRQDPLIEPEALLREVLPSFFHSSTDNLITKNPQQVMGGGMQQATAGQTGQASQLSRSPSKIAIQ